MAVKQPLTINFASGLDTKTDPKQVTAGKFLSFENIVFNNGGLAQKRDGFEQLTTLPNADSTYLTTFNGNLTSISDSILAFSTATQTWVSKGQIQPLSLNVLPLFRSNTNQIQADSAIAPNGLICTVFTDSVPVNGTPTNFYKYVIANSTTGQNVVAPTLIPSPSGAVTQSPRVFLMGNYFIILFVNTISSTAHLQYIAISTFNPNNVTTAADVSTAFNPYSSNINWDAVVVNSSLYISYYTSADGVNIKQLTQNLALTAAVSFSTIQPQCLSMCVDMSNPSFPIIYSTWYDSVNLNIVAVNTTLGTVLGLTQSITALQITNITCAAQNGSCQLFYEVSNQYSYDDTLNSDYIGSISVSQSGTIGSAYVVVRSLGLASKSFISDGVIYLAGIQVSAYQPTYFLVNGSISTSAAPVIIGKLAYSNGGSTYLSMGLPNVTVNGNVFEFPYLFKDSIASVSKATNVPSGTQVAGIYSQTGINLSTWELSSSFFDTVEIASTLHMSGGFLWMYDGYLPVEHNFLLWPENLEAVASSSGGAMAAQKFYYQGIYEWTDDQGNQHQSAPSVPVLCDLTGIGNTITFTATFTSGVHNITVSSAVGLYVGMTVTDTTTSGNIQSGTLISAISGNIVTLSKTTSGTSGSPDTMSASTAAVSFTVTAAQGNQLYVSSTTGLFVGQYLFDSTISTNIQADTWITAIDSTNKILTLNLPPAASPVGDTIYTNSLGSAVISMPTLRVTYKIASPVKLVIYRWSTNQEEYYQVTSVSAPILNDTTIDSISFTDTNSDLLILGNSLIYTTGGVVEDINAPASNIMTLWNTRLFLVDAEDPNLIWFSKQVIEATPVEMSDLLTLYVAPTIGASGSTGPITALGAMDSNLIIFKRDAIYYVTGTGPDNTGANNLFTDPIFITSVVGCSNQQSVVFTPSGLMFQTDKGIWMLARNLATEYIGAAVEKFVLGQNVLSAVTVPGTNQVRFTMDSGITLVYDYYYGQWSTFVGISGISSCIYENLHTYLDKFGNVFQENPGSYLDGSNPVLMQFTTSWLNLAGILGYQRIYEFNFLGTYLSPHLLAVGVAYDYGPMSQQAIFQPSNYVGPFGTDALFGQTSPYGGPGSNEDFRIQTEQQKCSAFQITVQEVFDSSFGTIAGAGFNMSGIDCVIGMKKGWRPYSAGNTAS